MKVKSNIYLFRVNGWLFYGTLVISCLFNWDAIITKYNIYDAKWIEKNYLLGLSDTNLPQLFILQQDTTSNRREFSLSKEKEQRTDYYDSSDQKLNFNEHLGSRLYYFLSYRENINWKSWYYDNVRIYNELKELKEVHVGNKIIPSQYEFLQKKLPNTKIIKG